MRGHLTFAAALLVLAAPACAHDAHDAPVAATPEDEVRAAAEAFMQAIGNTNKAVLAEYMIPEGVIFIHSRMDPDNPRVDIVPVSEHVSKWPSRSGRFIESMRYDTVLVDGDMAQVWGRYSFFANSRLSHCGINSLSMVKTESGWKVANTSFTMEPPSECERLGAPDMNGK